MAISYYKQYEFDIRKSKSLIHQGFKTIIKGGLRIKKFSEELTSFIQEYPEVWEAHEKTGELVHSAGPLDKKTCHLIQLGMAASAQLHGAVRSHVTQAFEAGATREEIYQTILLTLNTVGFPKMIMTYGWIRELIERLEKEKS